MQLLEIPRFRDVTEGPAGKFTPQLVSDRTCASGLRFGPSVQDVAMTGNGIYKFVSLLMLRILFVEIKSIGQMIVCPIIFITTVLKTINKNIVKI